MRIRVRGPAGQSVLTLPDAANIGDLQEQITNKTGIANFEIKYGYPPKPLQLEGYSKSSLLSDLDVKFDGEQLIVSEKPNSSGVTTTASGLSDCLRSQKKSAVPSVNDPSRRAQQETPPSFSFTGVAKAPPNSMDSKTTTKRQPSRANNTPPLSLARKQQELDAPELPLPSHAATLLLRIMPDDNSCLFRAFNSAYFGAMDNMTELRSVIAQHIQAHPEEYPAVVLEKDPDDYCRWIQSENSWGGAIELDILSKHFDIEICSIDVQTLRVDRWNEGKPKRCILVYSGIHYDVIALSASDPPYTTAYAPPEFDEKIFDAVDQAVLETAVELCRVLQRQHYYTDTGAFTVRCNVCGGSFKGEKGATEHAKETGHYDFGEAG
ncbi:MAG: hypothetical protein Q9187_002966 [Circinaria calcarea]